MKQFLKVCKMMKACPRYGDKSVSRGRIKWYLDHPENELFEKYDDLMRKLDYLNGKCGQ